MCPGLRAAAGKLRPEGARPRNVGLKKPPQRDVTATGPGLPGYHGDAAPRDPSSLRPTPRGTRGCFLLAHVSAPSTFAANRL